LKDNLLEVGLILPLLHLYVIINLDALFVCWLTNVSFSLWMSIAKVGELSMLCICFVDRFLPFCTFSFGHCVICSSIDGFWLPLWYLQTFFIISLFLENKDTIVLFTVILSYKIATIDNSPTFAIDIHKLKETFVSQQTKSASRLIITYKCNRGRIKPLAICVEPLVTVITHNALLIGSHFVIALTTWVITCSVSSWKWWY
jgi:hypothetical protein